MRLSILIPGLPHRDQRRLFVKLQSYIDVEVLCLLDNKRRTLSQKRNDLINLAKGEYVSFIDDDDDISEDYVEEILKAIEHKPDVICFKVKYQGEQDVIYSINNEHKYENGVYYRKPNDKMCHKRENCLVVPYEDIPREDDVFGEKISKLIKNEYQIDKVLYHYNFSPNISECLGEYWNIGK